MATKLPLPGGDLELHSSGDLSKDPEARLLYNRGRFSQEYAAARGWPTDFSKLSFEQIGEIRSQPEWKHAAFLPYPDPPVEAARVPTFAEIAEHYEPPTGDDLTAIAQQWGIQRDMGFDRELTDEELTNLLTAIPVLWGSDKASVASLESALMLMPGVSKAKITNDSDEDRRWFVLYQGRASPEDVLDAVQHLAPVTCAFRVERLEGEWPK